MGHEIVTSTFGTLVSDRGRVRRQSAERNNPFLFTKKCLEFRCTVFFVSVPIVTFRMQVS